ncbi:MAG TPA: hypothetical protein VIY90_03135 [Steroidobacteraceae bacterium]
MRDWLRILLGAIAVIAMMELLLRALPVSTGLSYQASSAQNPVVRGKPNLDYTYSSGWNLRMVQHGHLNNFGFPAVDDYDPNAPNIIVVGDSYVESLMLRPADRLQVRLEQQLHHLVRVYGIGRSGSNLAQKLGAAKWAFSVFRPKVVIINLNDTDVASSLTSPAGDFYFSLRDKKCELLRTERPPEGLIGNLVRSSMLYHYLTANLRITVTLRHIFGGGETALWQLYAPESAPIRARIAACVIQLLPELIHLPPERVIFVIGSDLDGVYGSLPARELDIDPVTAALELAGYQVVRSDPIFRKDYAIYHMPLSFRPVDDHWNARAQALVAAAVAARVGPLLIGAAHDMHDNTLPRR